MSHLQATHTVWVVPWGVSLPGPGQRPWPRLHGSLRHRDRRVVTTSGLRVTHSWLWHFPSCVPSGGGHIPRKVHSLMYKIGTGAGQFLLPCFVCGHHQLTGRPSGKSLLLPGAGAGSSLQQEPLLATLHVLPQHLTYTLGNAGSGPFDQPLAASVSLPVMRGHHQHRPQGAMGRINGGKGAVTGPWLGPSGWRPD